MTTKIRREFETLASAAERTGLSIRTLRKRITSGRARRLPHRSTRHPGRP